MIPQSTYRFQFHSDFNFKDAETVVPYLNDLGISHIYASPIFQARPGSRHGYDIVDPCTINPELGGEEGFEELSDTVQSHGLAWLQDIVPNHMAYDMHNRRLMDVFENRERSPYFHFFDIDWQHPYESFQGRLLAPVLGKFYSEALEDGEISLTFDEDGLAVKYYDWRFPLWLETYQEILTSDLHKFDESIGQNHSLVIQFIGVIDMFKSLTGGGTYNDPGTVKHAKETLWSFTHKHPQIRSYLDELLAGFNAQTHEGFQRLDTILARQCFRLSYWKVASEELNYRRFFTINDLITVNVNRQEVFEESHALIFKLLKSGRIQGVRIDHIDGLSDPVRYLHDLKKHSPETYVVCEKILAHEENLPSDWPVQGTSGYDFLAYVNGLFCRHENLRSFARLYYQFSKMSKSYARIVADQKRLIIGKYMAGDVDNLAYMMKDIAGRFLYGRDITLYGLKRALVEVLTFFPVYRTYVRPDHFDPADQAYVQQAIEQAARHAPGLSYEINFIKKFILLELVQDLTDEEEMSFWRFMKRFQQLSAPIMAKGFEDTTFYIYNMLVSQNEVGGEPNRFGVPSAQMHDFCQKRSVNWPHSMNASATHDTKRGEDTRARINVLSEMPGRWKQKLNDWRRMNRKVKKRSGERVMPDANDEYFLYQNILGAYPFMEEQHDEFVQRMKDYMIKAVREAKLHTGWIRPDDEYEQACLNFITSILTPSKENVFWEDFKAFQAEISHFGMINSLSQTLIKLTAPGVPDIYQGCELWDLSLVDPDNRRPVDYSLRRKMLDELIKVSGRDAGNFLGQLRDNAASGQIKMYLMHHALQLRRVKSQLFESGEYVPVTVKGKHSQCVFAFLRKFENGCVLSVVPRFPTMIVENGQWPLGETVWEDTFLSLPESIGKNALNNVFTGQSIEADKGEVRIADLLKDFPVGLAMCSCGS